MRLTNPDIAAISVFLKIGEYEFVQRYTRLRPKRDGLALIDKPNGECVFLDGIDCTIQAVKPRQQIFPRHGRMQNKSLTAFDTAEGFETPQKTPCGMTRNLALSQMN